VIISRALARQSFPDRDPLGKYLLVRDSQARFRPLQIVGVAGDVRHTSLEAEAEPHVYLPYHQTNPTCSSGSPTTSSSSCARRARPSPSRRRAARAAGGGLDGGGGGRPRERLLPGQRDGGPPLQPGAAGRLRRLALALAAIGIYGVVSYTVAQRTREIGVRLALGAEMGDIVRMVLGEGVRRTAAGVALGLAGAARGQPRRARAALRRGRHRPRDLRGGDRVARWR
jgi:hypothetical protein